MKRSSSFFSLVVCVVFAAAISCGSEEDFIGPSSNNDSNNDENNSTADMGTNGSLAALGEACTLNSQCVSNLCETFGDESFCTSTCVDSCSIEGTVCYSGICTPEDYCEGEFGPGCAVASCDQCDSNATCTATMTCECNDGYQGAGTSCTDIDECASGDPCPNGTCLNTEGGFECQCAAGYEDAPNGACVDVNECDRQTDDCGEGSLCVNLDGSFECQCDAGYVDVGGECVQIGIMGDLSADAPGQFEDGTIPPSCAIYRQPDNASGYYYQGSTGDGFYTIDPDGPGGAAEFAAYCDMTTDGGGWTRVGKWDRQNDNQTVADFRALMTQDFDNMGQFDDRQGFIRWSDADSTYDSMSYSLPVEVPNIGEVLVDVNYQGVSMEASGVWFWATAGGNPRDILCWDDANATNYTAADLAQRPGYSCANDDPATSTITWTWDRAEQESFGSMITSFHITSLHADCCVDDGDSSDLYRFEVLVR